MGDNVYKVNEVVGSSASGVDAAIANAISRTSKTVRNLEWFEVVEVRGHIVDGAIEHTQVTLKVGFRVDAAD
jgi:flavin-binding protein dodecin